MDIARALSRRAKSSVSDDILIILKEIAANNPDPERDSWREIASSGQPYYGGDPHHQGINSVRGQAIRSLCECALEKKESNAIEIAFQGLEHAAQDPTAAVRSCVIESLVYFLRWDDIRTLAIFETAMRNQPELLRCQVTHRLLYYAYREHFKQVQTYIEVLLDDDDKVSQKSGAQLACLSAFNYPEAESLAEKAIAGNTAMRLGAASIYSRNLELFELEATCLKQLECLLDDPIPKRKLDVK
jgi:hypothetical protein